MARVRDLWQTKEEEAWLLRTVLALVDRLARPLAALGVDVPAFRELLRVRIVLDLRPSAQGKSGLGLAGVTLAVLASWLLGVVSGITALGLPAGTWVLAAQSMLLFLLLVFLANALVGMLLDPADLRVYAPHPVSDRTLFAVRLAQVFGYLAVIAVGFVAGGLPLAVFAQPVLPTLLVYPLLAVACILTTLGGVALAFALLLRIVGPERFQRVSLWVQVGGAALAMGGLQLGPRLLPESLLERLWGAWDVVGLLWPPEHFSRAFRLAAGEWTGANVLGLAGTLLFPALALWTTLRLASRSFAAGLEGALQLGSSRSSWSLGLGGLLGRLAAATRCRRAGFDVVFALSRREPNVLRQGLPQLFSLQFPMLAICIQDGRDDGPSRYMIALSIGMVAASVPVFLQLTQGTPHPEARWIYGTAPVGREDEHELVRGGAAAVVLVWFLVPALAVCALHCALWGPALWPTVLLAAELSAVIGMGFASHWSLTVPFSQPERKASGMENMGLMFMMMFAIGLAALVPWLVPPGTWTMAAAVPGALLVLLWWRRLGRLRSKPLEGARAGKLAAAAAAD